MKSYQVLTPWITVEEESPEGSGNFINVRMPKLTTEFDISYIEDVTGQPPPDPDPNNFTVLVISTDEVLTEIAEHSDYTILNETIEAVSEGESNTAVSKKLRDKFKNIPRSRGNGNLPSQSDFGQFRASMARMKDKGRPIWTNNQLNEAIGTNVNGRSWAEINNDLLTYLKSR